MHEVLVNRLGGLSLPRKSLVRLTDRPDMTLDVYRGRKTTMQQQQPFIDTDKNESSGHIVRMHKLFKYSIASVARTLMDRLPWLFRTRSWVPRKNSYSCRHY